MKPAPGHRRINPNAAKRSPFAARGSGVDFAGAFWDLKSALVPWGVGVHPFRTLIGCEVSTSSAGRVQVAGQPLTDEEKKCIGRGPSSHG
jgi:hypothetical protein